MPVSLELHNTGTQLLKGSSFDLSDRTPSGLKRLTLKRDNKIVSLDALKVKR